MLSGCDEAKEKARPKTRDEAVVSCSLYCSNGII